MFEETEEKKAQQLAQDITDELNRFAAHGIHAVRESTVLFALHLNRQIVLNTAMLEMLHDGTLRVAGDYNWDSPGDTVIEKVS